MGLEMDADGIRFTADDGRLVVDTRRKLIHQLGFASDTFTTSDKGPSYANGPYNTEGSIEYDLEGVSDARADILSGLFRVTSKQGIPDGGVTNGSGTIFIPPGQVFPGGDRLYIYAPHSPPLNEWVSANGPAMLTTIGQESVVGGRLNWRGTSYHFVQFFIQNQRIVMREDYIRIHGSHLRNAGTNDFNIYKPARLTIEYRLWYGTAT